MNDSEIDTIIRSIGDVFDGQQALSGKEVELWYQWLKPYRYDNALAAVYECRRKSKYTKLSFAELESAIRTQGHGKAPSGQKDLPASTLPQMLKARYSEWSQMTDYEVLLRYHRGLWLAKVKPRVDADKADEENERMIIAYKCEIDLRAAGMMEWDMLGAVKLVSFQYAQRASRIIFEDAAFFEMALADVLAKAPKFIDDTEPRRVNVQGKFIKTMPASDAKTSHGALQEAAKEWREELGPQPKQEVGCGF